MGKGVVIYGDSVMKGTIIDEQFRYKATMMENIRRFVQKFAMNIINKARFGMTISQGYSIMKQDLKEGLKEDFALVEFGGNDCNFKWDEVARDPEREHLPMTPPDLFKEYGSRMVTELKAAGVQPVLMTLPPIDAERYLAFIGKSGNDCSRILQWLGDVQMIYRFQESYSNAIMHLALETGIPLIDVRSSFLDKHNYRELIGIDGLHPTTEGYRLVCDALEDFVQKQLAA